MTYGKRRINRVRFPILPLVSWTEKMNISLSPFAPENLVSRDGFGSPVPRQPAHLHTQAESAWCLLAGFLPISAAATIYLFEPPDAIGSVPSLSGHAIAYRWRSLPRVHRHRASKPQGINSSKRVLPWHVTIHGPINMRLSLSRTHYTIIGMKWTWHVESTGVYWQYSRH